MSTVTLTGLAQAIVKTGLLDRDLALDAVSEASKKKEPLAKYLFETLKLNSRAVASAASRQFGVPLIDLEALDTTQLPLRSVPENLLRKHLVLPLYLRGRKLFVAVSDPSALQALDDIRFGTGLNTSAVVAEHDKIVRILDKALEGQQINIGDEIDEDLANLEISSDDDQGAQAASEADVQDAPVVKFVNKVLLDAIQRKASDIHLEPYEFNFRVRFRIDGMLHEVAAPPKGLSDRIIARVKVMSRMDIAERRIPQDGRIKLNISKTRAIDFRVNTCPTLFGEKVVLRILDPSSAKLGIDMLGYEADQKQLYLDALSKPYGMILVTGPTGSGKTVSLYTGLNILNTPDRNISTAEDPAEINMPGVNQVNVNTKVGLTFASALRAFLRQDPDVIMVGEIRDLETAEIAIKAAQTGHLVLSTLHTNDAPQTLTRLANMGVPPYNIASSILLIIAQRLARRLCPNCKAPDNVPREELLREGFTPEEIDAGLTIFKPVGCDQCTEGYKGRVGVYQVMPISEEMGRIIMRGGTSLDLADQARKEGVRDLRASGLLKVKAGLIGLEELNRVTVD
ncbi:MAG: type IV-A pilus assembly ATPase PilB [Halothiobacillaceae bacterium]|jgi:type IV pilus assembly protein PilB|nr:type IV-A pilus assembly ATPase PilB [Halothiobacillaceae bacterium]MDY0049403.1 type IV-A pilus assembly ATPase PilB [Halothiobacillaceae bacterium]